MTRFGSLAGVGFLRSKGAPRATGRARIIRDRGLGYTQFSGQGANRYVPTGGATLHTKIWVHVSPDAGGSEFESQAKAWGGDEEHLVEGHETYVLYDPEHPEHCDIDRDRLEHEFGRVGGKRRTAIPGWATAERAAEQKARADGTLKPGEKFDPLANMHAWTSDDLHSLTSDNQQKRPADENVVTGLKDLVDMHASGALSDAEFAEAKSRLLGAN